MSSSDMSEAADSAAQFTAEGLKEESAQAVVRALARTAQGVISPMCATVGGVVGQEALKAVSGKFMPIMQWLYYDAVEALPDEPLPAEEVAPKVTVTYETVTYETLYNVEFRVVLMRLAYAQKGTMMM
jgi:hypothetical protein